MKHFGEQIVPMKYKENSKKRKKRKNRKNNDVLAVLFIFSLIILFGIVISLFHDTKININLMKNATTATQKEKIEGTSIIVATGAVAVVIAGVFVVVKIKYARKRKKYIEEKMNRRRELEEARKRIEQARYDDILSAGNAVLKSRRDINSSINRFESGIHHKYDLNNIEDDMYDKKKRVGIGHEHDYYDYKGYEDYEDYDDYEEEYIDIPGKLNISKKRMVIAAITLIVVLCSILFIFFIL